MTISSLSHRQKTAYASAFAVIACVFFFASVPWKAAASAFQTTSKVTYPQEVSRVTFAAAGDVIPHQAVSQSAAAQKMVAPQGVLSPDPAAQILAHASAGNHDGWDAMFADVADVFRSADFGFVNLETPVAPKHSIGSKAFQFNAPLALIEALHFSGVKIVSFANNHVFDQNYAGFDESLSHLREENLPFTGSGDTADDAWRPVVLEKNGIKVGLLGMTRWLNGHRNPEKDSEPHVAFFPYPGESVGAPGRDEAAVLAAIKSARADCDFLIVSIHWGIEYSPAPRPDDLDLAHKMLEAGAGMVIGHHPHVLQPVETYLTQDQRHTIVIFSLGNFLSNQSRDYVNGLAPDKDGDPRDEMVVKFAVVKKNYGPAGIHFELADMGIMPVWEENNHLRFKSGKDKIPVIRPQFIDRLIPSLQARLDTLNQLGTAGTELSPDQKQEFLQVTQQLATLKHRREIILDRTGDDFAISPPNP
jgi:poly-gamma-glutamate capsule biosynthesis protein CapA/YwtB (metallophosphatase superfamily)